MDATINGTNLCLTDDTVTEIELPFDFNFYGENYTTMTVSSNGWASFEKCEIPYFWNFSIPFPLGPSAMLAPCMDDLDDYGKLQSRINELREKLEDEDDGDIIVRS